MNTSNSTAFGVVTGASSGIGYEIAKELARRGYGLIIAAEDDRLATVAAEIQRDGTKVTPVKVDLRVTKVSRSSIVPSRIPASLSTWLPSTPE